MKWIIDWIRRYQFWLKRKKLRKEDPNVYPLW